MSSSCSVSLNRPPINGRPQRVVRKYGYLGQTAPYSIRIKLIDESGEFDLTTSTAGRIEVRKPDETVHDWFGIVENMTTSTAEILYVLSNDDLNQLGTYRLVAALTIDIGDIYSFEPFLELEVINKDGSI